MGRLGELIPPSGFETFSAVGFNNGSAEAARCFGNSRAAGNLRRRTLIS